ncbi:MAG: 5-formyltetrahydrofolate cyclo-ligase [Thermoplasmata archaeon]|nr:MAG: 5-formyltetrahydrofolate cyclo-ligase [Thermoplasmata archaeon]
MKEHLRRKIKNIRLQISEKEVLRKSHEIKKKLFSLREFKRASSILFYVSYNNEVCTHDMIRECLSSEKSIVVPLISRKNKKMFLSKLNSWDELEPGEYSILQPCREYVSEVSVNDVDIIIVPGIVFDEKGHRIGHGLGYYDRLLSDSKNALHIGLAFEFQIVDRIPVEKHDVAVDKIVTEKRVIHCSP